MYWQNMYESTVAIFVLYIWAILWLIYDPCFVHGPSNILAILKIFTRNNREDNSSAGRAFPALAGAPRCGASPRLSPATFPRETKRSPGPLVCPSSIDLHRCTLRLVVPRARRAHAPAKDLEFPGTSRPHIRSSACAVFRASLKVSRAHVARC